MPIVIRRNNRPSGWEQLGRGIQDTIKQYQQGNVALSKEQDLITREMLNLALQDRRMRDANARDERRTQMTLDLERRRAEQDDKWRRGLRQQDSGLRQSAGSGSRWQAANMKDRTDTPVRFNAYAGETVPSGEWGGENRSVASGPGNPQLSATLNAVMQHNKTDVFNLPAFVSNSLGAAAGGAAGKALSGFFNAPRAPSAKHGGDNG